MKGRLIALDLLNGRKAAALMVDGRLNDLLVDPGEDGPPRPGTVFRAIADRPMKGMGGAIVKLPGGQSGFLRDAKTVRPGQPILVQVGGYAEPGKAVPVSARVLLKGRLVIATPGAPGINVSRQIRDADERGRLAEILRNVCPEGTGLIVRSAAEGIDAQDIVADAARQLEMASRLGEHPDGEQLECLAQGPDAHEIALRDWKVEGPLDDAPGTFARHAIDDAIEALASPFLALAGGGSAWIEPTRALIAIDVNTGPDTSAAAGLKANIELARALPAQLRCRGLGGQVTVDFAPFAKAARKQVENALRAAFSSDPVETALVGWTPLGHFELQRKRERLPFAGVST